MLTKLTELIKEAMQYADNRKDIGELHKPYEEYIAEYLIDNNTIVTPCKVGDVVWLIGNMKIYTKEVCCSRKVTSVQMLRTGELIMHFKDGCFCEDSIGVYVFHTKEEAEKALKGEGK